MSNLKYYNDSTGQWEYLVIGKQGPTGPTGATGATGNDGALSPNYIINGAFDIWQRGTSFTGGYTADRWFQNLSGATGTTTRQAFTPGDVEVIGFGDAEYFLRTQVTVGNDNAGPTQLVEDVRTLAGQEVTLSAWVRSSDATYINFGFQQYFGSGGSSTVGMPTQQIYPTSSWVRYSKTFTLPSVSGKTIGSGSYLRVLINNPNTETFTLDIWGVQLEAGSVATPFKRHAPSLQGELAACQRYYWRTNNSNNHSYNWFFNANYRDSDQVHGVMYFPTEMRIPPDISGSGSFMFYQLTQIRSSSTTPNALEKTTQSAGMNLGGLSGLSVDFDGSVRSNNDSSAYMEFDAEL